MKFDKSGFLSRDRFGKMAELSDEEIDVVNVDQDDQDDPEPNRSFSGLSSILYFILCCLFYLYILSCLFLTMVIPTSIAPILNHPVDINVTSDTINTTDKNGKINLWDQLTDTAPQ